MVSFIVVGSKVYITWMFVQIKIRFHISTQYLHIFVSDDVIAEIIEHVYKPVICLAIYFFEFDVQNRMLSDDLRMKKKHTRIVILKDSPFFIFYHRRQLQQVSDIQNLHTSEWLITPAYSSYDKINSVQYVSAQHTYFIYHE